MILKRDIESTFLRAVKSFPVVIITGARQSGKTTLCRKVLKDSHRYVSMEDTDIRLLALKDPRSFLESYPPPVILDEIQYAPDLPSYIQGIVDKNRQRYGQFILTGSQNFLLMQQVSQSLAGRAMLLELYPLSIHELGPKLIAKENNREVVADWILKGSYPELRARRDLNRRDWCRSYIRLYLERDVRRVLNVGDLDLFERFLQIMAGRTATLINLSEISKDLGVSQPTIKRWISILQASYQVFKLPPYHANITKRLVKAPKIYFGDTALATYLVGIHDISSLSQGPFFGPLFETVIVNEHIKFFSSRGDIPRLSFFRSHDNIEVDLLIEEGGKIYAREIKCSKTVSPYWAESLIKLEKLLRRPLIKTILAPINEMIHLAGGVTVKPFQNISLDH